MARNIEYVPGIFESAEFYEGYEAYWNHVEQYKNPYKSYTPEAIDWNNGWESAESDDDRDGDYDEDGDYDAEDEDTE